MIYIVKTFKISNIFLFLFILFLLNTSNVNADVLCDEGSAPEIKGEIVKGDFLKLLKCLDSFTKKGETTIRTIRRWKISS